MNQVLIDEVQTQRLHRLVVMLRAANLALVGEDQQSPQIVQRLALVELDANPLPILGAVQAAHDVDALDQSPVLLERSHERF